ncbi:hypothetical protein [Curtobacterium sp. 9128]|uniref:hypothetical protein n=1 Tax=Curtobacterium sp. 9128 TaxID=1793722 RepID=UPI00119FB05E|nr:hypothetical protein [Curtobacterium sp. 9128]
MAVITDCTNRRAHRHTLRELRPLDAHADRVPRNLIDKYIELHEQPDARKQHQAAMMSTLNLRDLGTFLLTYRPMPTPPPKNTSNIEPILDMYNARAKAAAATLLADEHIAAHQLGITLDALRSQHWHTTNSPRDHTEKRGALALLRAGLLGHEALHHALSICGVHGWDDLTTFREPDAPRRTSRRRDRNAATFYQRLPKSGEEDANPTIRPRGSIPLNHTKRSANATR